MAPSKWNRVPAPNHKQVDTDRDLPAGRGYSSQRDEIGRQVTGSNDQVEIVSSMKNFVGNRAVQRGGVRLYSRMTGQPVEQDIDLREERSAPIDALPTVLPPKPTSMLPRMAA